MKQVFLNIINGAPEVSTFGLTLYLSKRFLFCLVPRDELREIFNDISSSSEDEDDDGDRHEDEDLNIMDIEDDMVGRLNEKLNEGRDENNRNNQIGMCILSIRG